MYFVAAAAIDAASNGSYVSEYIDVGEGFTGIEKTGICFGERGCKLSVLLIYFLCMVNIQRRSKLRGCREEEVVRERRLHNFIRIRLRFPLMRKDFLDCLLVVFPGFR